MPPPTPLPDWDPQELEAWLRLALTPGVGNTTSRRLLTQYGAPQEIFHTSAAALQSCASAAQAEALTHRPEGLSAQLDTTWAWLANAPAGQAHALITLGDPRYPTSLLHTEDPPLMLYAVGPTAYLQRTTPILDMAQCLAVVGTRNPTAQGADNAHQFAHALANMGWCIVSGLAAGVDGAAHQGALRSERAGAPPVTVAVLGTGVDRIYPRQHEALTHAIAARGLLLSELPLGTPPVANHFPKRNRIITGLSRGTLVVEAALASGSLISARLASEQGREVFAIPGSIHAPQSRGCHFLIRQGAKLVETAQDIAEELPAPAPVEATTQHAAPPSPAAAPATADPVLDALGFDPCSLDQLVMRSGWDAAHLQARLLELELDGHVAALPGGWFQRVVRT